MIGIYNDKVDKVESEAQLQAFNLAQLQHVVCMLEQRHQDFEISSVADPQENNQQDLQQDAQVPPQDHSFQYPTTPARGFVRYKGEKGISSIHLYL